MLEQAIIDAKELKEAAQQNAQEAIIERYQKEIKDTVDKILEQEDPMAELAGMGGAEGGEEDPMAEMAGMEGGEEDPMAEMGGMEGDTEESETSADVTSILEQLPFLQTTNEKDYVDLNLTKLEENLFSAAEEILFEGNPLFEEEEDDVLEVIDLEESDPLEEDFDVVSEEFDLFDEELTIDEDVFDSALAHEGVELIDEDDDGDGGLYEDDVQKFAWTTDGPNPGPNYEEGDPSRISYGGTHSRDKWASGPMTVPQTQTEFEYVPGPRKRSKKSKETAQQMFDKIDYKIEIPQDELEQAFPVFEEDSLDEEIDLFEDDDLFETEDTGIFTEEDSLYFENKRKNKNLIKEQKRLNGKAQRLEKKVDKYGTIINKLKNELNESNLLNAKLLYQNRILDSVSLNERQKDRIVEAIQNTNSVEEAKVIFETLQSTVGTANRHKVPESLNEVVTRSSSAFLPRKEEKRKDNDPFAERMKALAGLK
jgi:hypothetical protein